MKIFIDIETVPAGDKPSIDSLTPPGTYKKADSIAAWYADTEARQADIDNIYRKRALSYTDGQVICIAWIVEGGNHMALLMDNEEELFKAFESKLMQHELFSRGVTPTWVAHNGRGFDFPFLFLRACKYGCTNLAAALNPPDHRDFFLDTMKMYCLTDYKGMVSLKDACAFFGISTDKDEIDGSMVYDLYLENKRETLIEYCINDVENVRLLYYKLAGEKDKA